MKRLYIINAGEKQLSKAVLRHGRDKVTLPHRRKVMPQYRKSIKIDLCSFGK